MAGASGSLFQCPSSGDRMGRRRFGAPGLAERCFLAGAPAFRRPLSVSGRAESGAVGEAEVEGRVPPELLVVV